MKKIFDRTLRRAKSKNFQQTFQSNAERQNFRSKIQRQLAKLSKSMVETFLQTSDECELGIQNYMLKICFSYLLKLKSASVQTKKSCKPNKEDLFDFYVELQIKKG